MIDNLEHINRSLSSISDNHFFSVFFMMNKSRNSSRSFKKKRLADTLSQKSFVSQPILRIPRLSKASFQRWNEAQVAYLGHTYPYIQEPLRQSRRCSRRMSTSDRKSIGTETDQIETIEYNDEAIQTTPSPCPSNGINEEENLSDHPYIDYSDKATETDVPPKENTSQLSLVSSKESIVTTSASVHERVEQ